MNNINILQEVLDHTKENEFYMVDIIKNGELLKTLYIPYPKEVNCNNIIRIKELCDNNHAIAYISANVRNVNDMYLQTATRLIDIVRMGNYDAIGSTFHSVCSECPQYKYNVVTVNNKDINKCREIINSKNIIAEVECTDNTHQFIVQYIDFYLFKQDCRIKDIRAMLNYDDLVFLYGNDNIIPEPPFGMSPNSYSDILRTTITSIPEVVLP